MTWIKAWRVDEIPIGGCRPVAVADESPLLCRPTAESLFAVENACSHDDGALDDGRLQGTVLECPRHGARFDVTTGAVVRLPAATPLRTFPVRRSGDGWVEVQLEQEP